MRVLIVEADGGSRGNPGIAAGGAVVVDRETNTVVMEVGVYVGTATNNVAEYNGLIAGLECAYEIDAEARVHVRMDSRLVVEQMTGNWKVKHPDMADLVVRAHRIIDGREVTFEWVPRAENARADAVANRAMDARESFRA